MVGVHVVVIVPDWGLSPICPIAIATESKILEHRIAARNVMANEDCPVRDDRSRETTLVDGVVAQLPDRTQRSRSTLAHADITVLALPKLANPGW